MKCFYCGEDINKNGSEMISGDMVDSLHHFFGRNEVKNKLLKIFGNPDGDKEHIERQILIRYIHENSFKVSLHSDCHKIIEQKLKEAK